MNDSAHIAELHRAYVNLTGLDIALNMERERVWFEWLRFRRDDPFTATDIVLVVAHLRRGIREEKRNDGCLRFRNLIGDVESFDEERAAARKAAHTAAKPRPSATIVETVKNPDGSVTNTVTANAGTQDTSRHVHEVSEKALAGLQKLKAELSAKPSRPSPPSQPSREIP